MLTGELPLGKFPRRPARLGWDTRLDEVVFRTLEKAPKTVTSTHAGED